MNSFTVISALIVLFCSIAHLNHVNCEAYSYKVSVILSSTKKFDNDIDGKLKMTVHTNSAKQLVALSPDTETFKKGEIKTYLIAVPYDVKQITGVSLQWSGKTKLTSPRSWFGSKGEIYVDKVTLIPEYLSSESVKTSETKSFCNKKRPKGIEASEEESFQISC
ncbi:hypothetical protein HDE_10918 [Halotydeus destructor]|nr:hypothetical protein HDE_10918 [Halotydeus destructor]